MYADSLRKIQAARGWSKTQLAGEFHVSTQTISNWMAGRNTPSPRHGAHIQKLMNEQPVEPPPSPDEEPAGGAMGARVRQLRAAHGWSQTDLGQAIGTHYSTVNAWENGRQYPSPGHLRCLERLEAGLPAREFEPVVEMDGYSFDALAVACDYCIETAQLVVTVGVRVMGVVKEIEVAACQEHANRLESEFRKARGE